MCVVNVLLKAYIHFTVQLTIKMRNSILEGASFGFGYITFLTEYGKLRTSVVLPMQ